jgi:two-component sensor histidine kinase
MPYRIVERLQFVRRHPWLGYAAGSESLGMTVIGSLASQLGGSITWSGTAGTIASLTFPA